LVSWPSKRLDVPCAFTESLFSFEFTRLPSSFGLFIDKLDYELKRLYANFERIL